MNTELSYREVSENHWCSARCSFAANGAHAAGRTLQSYLSAGSLCRSGVRSPDRFGAVAKKVVILNTGSPLNPESILTTFSSSVPALRLCGLLKVQ